VCVGIPENKPEDGECTWWCFGIISEGCFLGMLRVFCVSWACVIVDLACGVVL
jgi:hypothetical protein